MQKCLHLYAESMQQQRQNKFLFINNSPINKSMPIYFRLSKLSQHNTESMLVWTCFLVVMLSVMHWGYCQTVQEVKNKYDNTNYNSRGDIIAFKSLFNSINAFFVVTGIVQLLASLTVVLLIYQVFGQTYNERWAFAVFILLILSLMFNFGAGVLSSMHADFFIKYAYLPSYYDGYEYDLFNKFQVFYAYSIVEAIFSFVIIIPLVSFILFTTLDLSTSKYTQNVKQSKAQLVQIKQQDSKRQSEQPRVEFGIRVNRPMIIQSN